MTTIATNPHTPAPSGRGPRGSRFSISDPGLLLRVLAWLFAILLLMASSTTVLYQREAAAERRVHEQRSRRVVDIGVEVVQRDLEAVTAEIRYLAGQAALREYLKSVPGARPRLESEFVEFCRHKRIYDQIRFLDLTGMERVRVNDNGGAPAMVREDRLQSKAARSYFVESVSLGPGEVYVSPFDLNVEHGQVERPLKPVIRFATPVYVDGSKRGVLILNYLGARLLRKVSEAAAHFPGEVALLNGEGYYLVHPDSRTMEWGLQLGHGHTYADQHRAAWIEILRQPEGLLENPEGMYAFRRVGGEHAPDGGLELVAHVPDERLRNEAKALLGTIVVGYGAVSPVLVGLVVFLAYVGTVRRRHERMIADSEARLRALSAQLLTAQEEERRTISRDLHDDLGQLVTAVGLKLDQASTIGHPEQKDRLIEEAKAGVKALIDRVREISTRLRPRMLDELGLKEAVRSFLGECEERLGITADADLRFDDTDLSPEIAENVYRILQEAATNVAKYAEVKTFEVRLRVGDEGVRLSVRDRGTGFEPDLSETAGLGLLGMRERVELLGGTFHVSSRPGRGTEITAYIPRTP